MGFRTPARLPLLLQVAIDRFQRDNSDPSVIVFSVIKRCQRPHSTQFFQKAKSPHTAPGNPCQDAAFLLPPFRRPLRSIRTAQPSRSEVCKHDKFANFEAPCSPELPALRESALPAETSPGHHPSPKHATRLPRELLRDAAPPSRCVSRCAGRLLPDMTS